MTYNFDFRGHITPFGPKITPKFGSFKAKNNAQTASKQLQTRFQKIPKNDFFGHKKGSNHGYQFWQMCRLGSWFVFSVFTILVF